MKISAQNEEKVRMDQFCARSEMIIFWVRVYLYLIYGFIYTTERIPGFILKFRRSREK